MFCCEVPFAILLLCEVDTEFVMLLFMWSGLVFDFCTGDVLKITEDGVISQVWLCVSCVCV